MGGDEGRSQGHDGKCSVQRCGGDDRPEGEGRKGHHGGNRGGCGGSVEEEWLLQDRRRVELEAEEKASDASQEGRKPIHKRTARFQSQASFEDRQGLANEEAEGDDQLEAFECVEMNINTFSKIFRVSIVAAVGGLTRSVARALYSSVARQRH